jgi:hypothetical protein
MRKMLAPERLWHQKSADTRKGSGTRKMLTPKRLWNQKNADTRKVLTPETLWHRNFSGVSVVAGNLGAREI